MNTFEFCDAHKGVSGMVQKDQETCKRYLTYFLQEKILYLIQM